MRITKTVGADNGVPLYPAAPDSRWTVRGSADDLPALLRRAADFVESLGLAPHLYPLGGETDDPHLPVSDLTLELEADELVLTVVFDHWQLPADLDYLDPRVAGDPGHGEGRRDDVEFMTALVTELGAHTIVDFGCGWGQLAVTLAQRGHRVTGVDASRAMLDLARDREGAELVEWIWGDFRSLQERADIDLVVMTGNIPSIYIVDETWHQVLSTMHAALRPGGHLAFGSWNPNDRRWERWGWGGIAITLPDNAGVRICGVGGGPGMELAEGRERLYAGSEYRYRTHEELTRGLTRAGFVVERTYGDWNRSPLTSASPDIVVVARRI